MADVLVYNAKVYLERGRFAEAVLVRDDRIAAVGANDEILSMAAANLEKIDAQGNLLLPGFNDSHLHLHDYGRDIHRIRGNGAASIDELVKRGRDLIDRLKPPRGAVITGTGWDQELLAEKRFPNRHDMDRISTEHAVIISRVCGHSLCCNSPAMRMAGVTKDDARFADEPLDSNGELLGIFGADAALAKIRSIIPPYTQKEIEEHLRYAMRHALENGISSAGTMDVFGENYQSIIDAYINILSHGDLRLRVNMQCGIEKEQVFNEFLTRGWITGASMGHPYLTMGASKLFADGSLGARTAYMREAYHDDPDHRGCQIHSPEEMDALVKKNHESGFQVIVHAIGDAAIEETINAFEKVIDKNGNKLRHGIVHCQTTDVPLLQRMATDDILAFMQPIFLTHDLYIIENRVGKDMASTAFALATMKKRGITAPYGTDAPVESISPLDCIDCAVNRHDISTGYPHEGFYPAECVDVYTAVDAYTKESAYAEFAETRKGRIRTDYLADMVLLDRDIFTIPRKEIHTAKVLWTMVGGKMAYRCQSLKRCQILGVNHPFKTTSVLPNPPCSGREK